MGRGVLKKLDGSTLIEVLIAMVIIMVVFSIALGIFNNVLNGSVSFKKVQVQQQLEILRKQMLENGKIEETHLLLDSVDYEMVIGKPGDFGTVPLEIKANYRGIAFGSIKFLIKENGK